MLCEPSPSSRSYQGGPPCFAKRTRLLGKPPLARGLSHWLGAASPRTQPSRPGSCLQQCKAMTLRSYIRTPCEKSCRAKARINLNLKLRPELVDHNISQAVQLGCYCIEYGFFLCKLQTAIAHTDPPELCTRTTTRHHAFCILLRSSRVTASLTDLISLTAESTLTFTVTVSFPLAPARAAKDAPPRPEEQEPAPGPEQLRHFFNNTCLCYQEFPWLY